MFWSPGWARIHVRNQFILQSQLHGLSCNARLSSRGAVAKVFLGRMLRLLLERSRCLNKDNTDEGKDLNQKWKKEHNGWAKGEKNGGMTKTGSEGWQVTGL